MKLNNDFNNIIVKVRMENPEDPAMRSHAAGVTRPSDWAWKGKDAREKMGYKNAYDKKKVNNLSPYILAPPTG